MEFENDGNHALCLYKNAKLLVRVYSTRMVYHYTELQVSPSWVLLGNNHGYTWLLHCGEKYFLPLKNGRNWRETLLRHL